MVPWGAPFLARGKGEPRAAPVTRGTLSPRVERVPRAADAGEPAGNLSACVKGVQRRGFKETDGTELFRARGKGSTSLTMRSLRSTFPARGEGAPGPARGELLRPFDIGRSMGRVPPARGERRTKAFTFRIVGQGAPAQRSFDRPFPGQGGAACHGRAALAKTAFSPA